ncbi:hypothetical protein BLOT_014331 [Blomia tropicalis]|nr:hypothetical protein BLOT_014331 [Blomia tropicalis]
MTTSYKPTTFHQTISSFCLMLIFLFFGYVLLLNTIHDADVHYGCYISVVEDQVELCCRSIFEFPFN